MQMRIGIFTTSLLAVGISYSEKFSGGIGENITHLILDISRLLPGKYYLELLMVEIDDNGLVVKHDVLNRDVIMFEIIVGEGKKIFHAANESWGYYELPSAQVIM